MASEGDMAESPLGLIRRSRIARRFLYMALVFIGLSTVGVGAFTLLYEEALREAELQERAGVLGEVLGTSLEHALQTHDGDDLDRALRSVSRDEAVAWIKVVGPDGAVLASQQTPAGLVPPILPLSAAAGVLPLNGVDYQTRVLPVQGEGGAPRAWVQLGFDPRSVSAHVRQVGLWVAILCPLGLLAGAAVALRMARRVVSPLRALLDGTQKMAAGQFNARVPVHSEDEVGQLAASFNNLSERLAAFEAAAASRQRTLEEEVSRQTEGLRAAVAESQEMARQAQAGVTARAQFLAKISHEIRTPMNAVLGMTELLLSARLTPEHRRLVETAHESGQALLGILNSVLDFSKAESAQMELADEPFSPRDLLEAVLSLNAEQAAIRHIDLGYHTEGPIPNAVRGDAGRVRQVLVNLLSNAVKFTERGQVTVALRATDGDGPVRLAYVVTDTGRGIAAADLSRLFRPFVQVDASLSREQGGTGLGLAISRELARRMGGDLTATSEEGCGSSFTFTLALERCGESCPSGQLPSAIGRRALLLGTPSAGIDTIADQVAGIGLLVERAPSAAALAARMGVEGAPRIDLLLVDLTLPTDEILEGLSAASRACGPRRVPTLLLSPVGATVHARVLLASGRAPSLRRPLRSTELREAIANLLGDEGAAKAASPQAETTPGLGARVLVVEDNPVNRIVAEGMLRQVGCQVDLAPGGEEGLALWKEGSYDLVFMDSQMPIWDGFRTTAALRRIEQETGRARTPVVALTAQAMPGDREHCLASGMDDYLAKPLRLTELRATLARWVHARPAAPLALLSAAPVQEAATVAEIDQSAVDMLLELDEGQGETLRSIFLSWETSAASLLSDIRGAVARGDAELLRAAAHPLKSSSASLGAVLVAALSQRLETAGREGNLDGVDRIVPRLERAMTRAREALAQLLPTREAPLLASPRSSGPLVLIVDDDATARASARAAIESLECRILEAPSGEEALALAERHMPNLILLDVMMRGMDGFEATRRLRALPAGRAVPILIMTGLDDMDSVATAYEVGATDFITKPLQPRILANRVRYMLRAGDAASALLQSEEMLSAAQQMAGLGTWVCDPRGGLVRCSPEAESIFGADGVATLDELHASIHPEDRAQVKAALADLHERGMPYLLHYRVAAPGRAHRTVQEQARLQRDAGGGEDALLGAVLDITDQTEARARIHALAYYDTVTGLPNRVMLMERLGEAIDRARRATRKVGLLFLDLDRFKRINDTLGHSVGDALLRSVANRVEGVLRGRAGGEARPGSRGDLLARLGGDEFVILLPDVDDTGAAEVVAERVLRSLRDPFVLSGHDVVISASVGTAHYPQDGEDIETLLRGADVAMYQVKESGGNGVRPFTEATGSAAQQRFAVEEGIRRGLLRGEFELHYQPKVDARTWQIVGCEALIRWRHPERGLVGPGEFIDIAEQTGLIVPLGEWALREACAQARVWLDQGLPVGRVAVNLSPRQFMQSNMVAVVRRALDDAHLDPSHLELEVTESGVMNNLDVAIAMMRQLGEMGVALALDDFGTGYSSLNYLRRFPLHTLKIDRSFVSALQQDGSDVGIITTTIIALGRALGLRVVAEGVETQGQLDVLRRAGCHEVQGYLISRPVPPALLAEQMARGQRRTA